MRDQRAGGRSRCFLVLTVLLIGCAGPLIEGGTTKVTGGGLPSEGVELRGAGENSSVTLALPNNSLVLSAKLDLLGRKYREQVTETVDDRADFLKANLTNISVGYDAAMLRAVPFLPADSPWDFFLGYRNATGVAAADLNGDGRADLAACYFEDGMAGLFPARPDGSFRAFEHYALGSGSRPVAVATGDLTGDGLADIAVADQALRSVWVLAQNATTHRLDVAARYDVAASLTDLAIGDFGSDGLLDVAAVSYSPCCVTVLSQDPSSHRLSPANGFPLVSIRADSIAAADVDGDTRTDIVAASPDGRLHLLKQGPGGLSDPVAYQLDTGYAAGAVAVGDVNASYAGREVLVSCANSAYQGFQLFYLSGGALAKGPLTRFPTDLPNQPPLALGAGDVDGDGQAEAVVGLNSLDDSELAIVNRTGAVRRVDFAGPARELLTNDLDGDGRSDIAAACPLRNGLAIVSQNSTGALGGIEEIRFVPSAVAVGDLNHDGRPDIAVSSRYCDRVGYRLNVGAGQYGDLYAAGPVNDPVALGISDLDGDGLPDLAALCRGNDTLAVMAQGTGSLRDPVYHDLGRYPSAVALGDVTGDGRADAVVAHSGEGYLSVLSQTKGGELVPDEDYAIGTGASSMALADLDADGRTDVAVAVRSEDTVRVLLQTQAGKLGAPASRGVGAGPVGLTAGDFDMDRRTDLVVASADPPSLTFLFQNASGGMDASPALPLPSTPVRVQLAEVDRDGLPEVWLLFRDGNLSMYRSDNYGGLLPAQNYTTERDHGTMLLDDLDGDGRTDVLLALSSGRAFPIVPQELQNGVARKIPAMTAPVLLQKADLDRDGLVDLLVASSSELWVYYQTPGGGFSAPQVRTWNTQGSNSVTGLAAGDLNGDGWPDVAVTGNYVFFAAIYYGGPAGLAAGSVEVQFGSTAYCYGGLVIADLTGDGLADLARTSYYGQIHIAAQTTTGQLAAPVTLTLGTYYPNGLVAGDINRDGYTDLLVGYYWYNRVSVLLGTSSGSFDQSSFTTSGTGAYYNCPLVISDLDGDGRNDLAVLCGTPKVIDLFLQNPDGTFGEKKSLPVSTGDSTGSGMDAGDIDADGRNELVASNSGSANLTIFDQGPDGDLFELGGYDTGSSPHGLVVADLNSDGAGDIAVAEGADNDIGVFYQIARVGTIELPPVHVPGGFLDTLVVSWNQTPPAPGCTVSASVSQNGINWTVLANNTVLAFTNVSQKMFLRLELRATSNGPLGLLDIAAAYVHSSFPTDPYLDIGADGTYEWGLPGNFSSKVTVSGGVLVAALNQYLQAHRAEPGPTLQVPLALGSATEGVLELTNISVEYDEPPHLLRPFPDDLAIYEDTAQNELLDLLSVFADDYDHILSYELLNLTNSTVVNVTIVDNAWLSVDAASWEASRNWSGEISFRIRATDGRGLSSTVGPVVVRILPVNDPPVISSAPPLNATVGNPYEYRLVASDVEGAKLTFLLVKGLPGMALDPASGLLTWFPRAEHLALPDLEVAVRVYDGEVHSEVQRFTLSLAPNFPPVISSAPPLSVLAGEEYTYRVNASDPEKGALTFLLAVAPAGMAIGTGGNVTWKPDAGQAGLHDVQISVSDGYNSVIQNFQVEVKLRTVENRRPEILSSPPLNATVNRTYVYQVQASDADNDPLRFWLEPSPQGMSIDNATGIVSWTPREWQAGNHTVVVRVSDGKASATQLFSVRVDPEPLPPYSAPTDITVRTDLTWLVALAAVIAGSCAGGALVVAGRRKWKAASAGAPVAGATAPAARAAPATGRAGSADRVGPESRAAAPSGQLPPAGEEPVVELLAAPAAGLADRPAPPAASSAGRPPSPPCAGAGRAMPPAVRAPPVPPVRAGAPAGHPGAEPWPGDDLLPALEPLPLQVRPTGPAGSAKMVREPERLAAPPPTRDDQIDEIFRLLGESRPPPTAPPGLASKGAAVTPRPPLPPRPPATSTVLPVQPRRDLSKTLDELMKMKKGGT